MLVAATTLIPSGHCGAVQFRSPVHMPFDRFRENSDNSEYICNVLFELNFLEEGILFERHMTTQMSFLYHDYARQKTSEFEKGDKHINNKFKFFSLTNH